MNHLYNKYIIPNINNTNYNNFINEESYIFYIIKTSNLILLQEYLKINPNCVYETDNDGNTPLFYSIYKNNFIITQILLINNSDPNHHNKKGISPLLLSFNNYDEIESLQIIKELIRYKADINEIIDDKSLLIYSIIYNNINAVIELLKNNVDVNSITSLNQTAIFYTISNYNYFNNIIKNNNLIYANLLLKHNADINIMDKYEMTPLSYALLKNNKELIELFIKNDADLSIYYNDVDTPLFYALKHNNKKLVKLLIKYKVDLNQKNKNKELPINYVITHNQTSNLKLLLKSNCLIPEFINNIPTIIYTMRYCNSAISRILIDNGIKTNYTDKYNNTILFYAVQYNKPQIITSLISNKFDINHINNKNKSIIHYISNTQNGFNILTLLLNNGFNQTLLIKYLVNRFIFSYNMNFILLILNKIKFNFYEYKYDYKFYKGMTVLHAAAFNHDVNVLKYFFINNKSIKIDDDNNEYKLTPMMCAIKSNNLECIKFLISKCANVNYVTNTNENLLTYAKRMECKQKILDYLESLGIIIGEHKLLTNDILEKPLYEDLEQINIKKDFESGSDDIWKNINLSISYDYEDDKEDDKEDIKEDVKEDDEKINEKEDYKEDYNEDDKETNKKNNEKDFNNINETFNKTDDIQNVNNKNDKLKYIKQFFNKNIKQDFNKKSTYSEMKDIINEMLINDLEIDELDEINYNDARPIIIENFNKI